MRANRHWEKDKEERKKKMPMWEDLTKGRLGTIASSAAAMVTPGVAVGRKDGMEVPLLVRHPGKKHCRAPECLQRPRYFSLEENPLLWEVKI